MAGSTRASESIESSRGRSRGEPCWRAWKWEYDSLNLLTKAIYPSGREVRYSYAGANPADPSQIEVKTGSSTWTTVANHLRRQGAGGPLVSYEANGLVTTLGYDLAGHLLSRVVKDGSTVATKREATLDARGNPSTITTPSTATNETFTYHADRPFLTSATVGSYSSGTSPYEEESYTYGEGGLGLRVAAVRGQPPYNHERRETYTYDGASSKLTELLDEEWDAQPAPNPAYDVKRTMTYAANGALETLTAYRRPTGQTTGWESLGTFTLPMDEEGRYTQLMSEYTYDHRWLRTRRDFSGEPLDFWHGPSGELVAELDCDGEDCDFCTAGQADAGGSGCAMSRPLQEYVWLDGAPIAMIESKVAYTGALDDTGYKIKNIHVGLLGEPRLVTNISKTKVWARDIPPFGATDANTSNPCNGLGKPEAAR